MLYFNKLMAFMNLLYIHLNYILCTHAYDIVITNNQKKLHPGLRRDVSRAPFIPSLSPFPVGNNTGKGKTAVFWICYKFLSFFVSLNVSSHYAVLSSVGLIHASSIVSSYVLLFVLHVVLLSFHISFQLFICLSV